MTTDDHKASWAGPQAVITLPAEIDMVNADEIRDKLLAAAGCDLAVLIIDMSGTTFCDSAGVRAIIVAHQQAAATRTQFRLVATEVSRILKLVGVDQLIPIYPTLQEALAESGPAGSAPLR